MNKTPQNDADVIVIGAGAAGLMAAGNAAVAGARVLLLEKTDSAGKKILVSGKTRCNLTNTADLKSFISMYGPNGRFLHSAFSRFFRPELLAFFERFGLTTKVERGGRIFPVSDDARDVVSAFQSYLAQNSVRIVYHARVISITRDISARKEKELALAASEACYRSLLLSIGEGFCHQDENEVFQFANPAAERIFGVGPGTLIGHRVQDFLDAEGLAIQQAQNERRRQDESSSFLTPIIRDDGVRRVLRVRASPVQDGSGRFQGSSVVFTDVTEEPSA